MPTQEVKSRSVKKGIAHEIIMSKIKRIYKMDCLNVRELARLCNIGYYRMRRLLFDKSAAWGADEWFKVLVVCDADGAVPQMYRATMRDVAKYQRSQKYLSKLPKTPGPLQGYRDKEVKVVEGGDDDDEPLY